MGGKRGNPKLPVLRPSVVSPLVPLVVKKSLPQGRKRKKDAKEELLTKLLDEGIKDFTESTARLQKIRYLVRVLA
jgi:hypothetical protein